MPLERIAPSAGLVADLVAGNAILAAAKVFDEYGHMSARHDADSAQFLMSVVSAPAMVTAEKIVAFGLDGAPVSPHPAERYHGERFIHSEIYGARPDVNAIVHCHAAQLLLFGVTGVALRPVYHMSGFLGTGVPVFDIRDVAGLTDMQVSSPPLGRALADSLEDKSMVLMRGHGATIVGASIPEAVFRAIYAVKNAELQLEAPKLGEVMFLAAEEAAKFDAMLNVTRAWDVWKRDAQRVQ
jgi:ribulose-5-phosphate 4-epimerase/fuculose-1-phosphate aldolase